MHLPADWQRTEDPEPGVALIAIEPDSAGLRTNVVLTVEHLGELSFRDWQLGTDQLLPRVLDELVLLDLERLDVDGHPGVRRLAHHTTADGEAATLEQWATLIGHAGVTLSATVATLRYDVMADDLAEIAATLRLSGLAEMEGV